MDTEMLNILKSQNIPINSVRPMIYMDECQDVFLLTKGAEIYLQSQSTLRVCLFNKTHLRALKKICDYEIETDDPWFTFYISVHLLANILDITGRRSQRLKRDAAYLGDLEQRLSHKIIKWTPQSLINAEKCEAL